MDMDANAMTVVRGVMEAAVGMPASIGGNVPALPKPPALEAMVFETPLLASVALVVAGLAAVFTLRASGKGRLGLVIGGVMVICAGGLLVTAAMVETARERMSRRTRELVRATATVDVNALRGLLAPDARLVGDRIALARGLDADSREEILSLVQTHIGGERVDDWAVLKMQAKRDGPNTGRTQTQVRVDIGGPNFSWWRIDWRLDEDGEWRVIGIEPLFIGGLGG
jgi:hypothetical protein